MNFRRDVCARGFICILGKFNNIEGEKQTLESVIICRNVRTTQAQRDPRPYFERKKRPYCSGLLVMETWMKTVFYPRLPINGTGKCWTLRDNIHGKNDHHILGKLPIIGP